MDITILKPRLDVTFKEGPVPKEHCPISPIRQHWENFVNKLSYEHTIFGDRVKIIEMPLWQMTKDVVFKLATQANIIYIPHKQKFEYKIDHLSDNYSNSDILKSNTDDANMLNQGIAISKKIISNTNITKVPIREIKNVEIELKKEIIIMERRAISKNESSEYTLLLEKPIEFRTEITIPVKIEVPVILKRSYIKEEIIVKSKSIIEKEIVTPN